MADATLGQRIKARLTYQGLGLPRSRAEAKFRDLAVMLIVAATIWGYVDVSRRGRIEVDHPEAHRTDFTVYVEAGSAFFSEGRDPYTVMNARGWTYLYPPLFALMVAPLAYLDTISQVSVWFVASVALAFGCRFEALRIWRSITKAESESDARPFPWYRFVPAAALAVWLPGLDCLQRGQLGIALLYSLLLGYRLVVTGTTRRAWGLGGFVLAWAVVLKLIPALPVGFLLFQQWSAIGKPRATSRATSVTIGLAIGLFIFALAGPALCVGWSKNLQYLAVWGEKVAFNKDPGLASHSDIDSFTNQSFLNASHKLVATFRGPVPEATMNRHWMVVSQAIAKRRREDWGTRVAVRTVLGVGLALLAAAGLKASRRGTRLGAAVAFGLSSMMIVMVAPVAWGHYYVLTLPAVLFAPRWLWSRGHPRAAVILATWAALCSTIHYAAMPWVGDLGFLGIGTAAWFLTVVVLYLWIDDSPKRDVAAIAGVRADVGHQLSSLEPGVTTTLEHAPILREAM